PPRRANPEAPAKTGVSKPGVSPTGGADEEEVLFETPEDILKEVKLRRPTLPKQLKKKEWEEEEEEGKEAAKVGKAGGKVKRRPKLIEEEEEEDLVASLQEMAAATMLTEAVLRPPKPKSRPT
ncbi:MAG TPA: translation initiation factor IF-2, partial [Cyanobacteria bacterium UBA11367]|nr:translation initiation factor IF-2 [Cyanobacteria bacterium UBA11367]